MIPLLNITSLEQGGRSWSGGRPLELHFGLGDADRVDDIMVRWPSGLVQRLAAQRARQPITITEGGG